MDKNRFFAAIITTLVIFAIVRTCMPEQPPKNLNDNTEVELQEIDGETPEKSLKAPQAVQPKLGGKTEVKASSVEGLKKKISKVKILKTKGLNNIKDLQKAFNIKSDHVYFKLKDGLALVGGDVVVGELGEEQDEAQFKNKLLKDKPAKSKLWPSADIPYGFAPDFPGSLKQEVLKAVQYYNKETVLNLFPADQERDEDIIVFKERDGAPCSSYLGRVGGMQPIYLNRSCRAQDVVHEVMHALGFVHEQQREERDGQLKILWDNIEDEYLFNFSLLPDSMIHQYQGSVFRIDFTSAMMYHDTAFSKTDPRTKQKMKSMSSKTRAKIAPTYNGLSKIDKERLQFLYGS